MASAACQTTVPVSSFSGADVSELETPVKDASAQPARGDIVLQRFSPKLDNVIAAPQFEVIANGFSWSEGPLWIDDEGGYLLFTDVPENKMYKWSRNGGLEVFMDPSGAPANAMIFREPGANGLIKDKAPGRVLVANHGRRAVTRLALGDKSWQIVIDEYNGKRLNSPNDLALASNGALFFTDPPYGLKDLNNSPYKELDINAVYRLDPNGVVTVLTDTLSFPNGVALAPDEKTLYVANSDPKHPIIMAYTLDRMGDITSETLFYDGSQSLADGDKGLPDGMAIDQHGHIFATAPGGVHIFTPEGELIGIINTGSANANCAIGENGRALYIAAHHRIVRVALNSNTGAKVQTAR